MLATCDARKAFPQCLLLCPIRELALQSSAVVGALAKHADIRVYTAVPGAERRIVNEQVVVGTPGTVVAKIKHRCVEHKSTSQSMWLICPRGAAKSTHAAWSCW